ncbi:MAG: glycosyltransferase [Dorea sp.]|nr:glycosyltransferase [Dorea sp.]
MKIMQIIPRFLMGGAEIMCENLSVALHELGHEVIVVSLNDYPSPITDRLEEAGLAVHYLHKKKGPDPFVLNRLRKLIKDEQPDVIHSHINSVPYAILAGKFNKVPHIHTIHSIAKGDNVKAVRKIIHWGIRHKLLKPVALGDVTRDSIAEEYQMAKDTIPIIGNGINLSRCIPKDSYDFSASFHIVHIGRFEEVKNHQGIVNGFAAFRKEHPDSRLTLVGDGSLRSEVENQIQGLHLEDAITLTGEQKNVFGYLHEADVFLLASFYEGLPMTLIEAMGTGLPLIVTNRGGIKDTLKDQEDAILIDPEAEAITKALTRIYESPDLRKKLGEKAKEHSKAFSSLVMAEKYLALYEDTLRTGQTR